MPDGTVQKLSAALELLHALELLALGGCLAAGLTGMALLLRGVAPVVAEEVDRTRASRGTFWRFLLGLINAPATLVVAAVLGKRGSLKLVAIFLVLALFALTLVGLVAELTELGRRLRGPGTPFSETLAGGAALVLTGLFPVVGQVLGVAFLVLALGTGISWLVTRGRGAAPAA
jgi:uncharacterized membrane protein YhaH (DUF805 family)